MFATPACAQEPIIPVGFHAGMPTIASFSFGGGTQLPHRGIAVLLAEPGIGGGRVAIGYLRLRPGTSFIGRATLLRTWGHPWETDPGHTFAGPELQAMFTNRLVGARAGVLFPLGQSRRSIATLGVVFGV
jgi:hypothetical protein